jgi:hypothetical protein
MSVSPTILFPQPPADPQPDSGTARAQSTPAPIPGSGSAAENADTQTRASHSGTEPDVVKVQLEPPDEIAVYQFVDQQGTLILQVPPQVLLNLARDISQELAAETAAKPAAVEGGKENGH